jgi:hypothetical protein
MSDFFTLGWLATAAGAVAAISLMVQATKFLIPYAIDPKIYCLLWSLLFSVARALWIAPAVTAQDWFCAFVNTVLLAVAATGTFEYAIKPLERKLLAGRQEGSL